MIGNQSKGNATSVLKMNMEITLQWVDTKYNEKYKSCLESLKDRFTQVYSIIKLIMKSMMDLNDLLKTEATLYTQYKPLIDNLIRLLDVMINEYPECLDLEFVEMFFSSVQERIQIFWAHFHQIVHINHVNPDIMAQIRKSIIFKLQGN